MEQREFLSKIQLPLLVKNAKVRFFSATIILGAEANQQQNKQASASQFYQS